MESKTNATRQWQVNEDSQVVLRGMPQPSSASSLAPACKVLNETIFNQSHFQQGETHYQKMIAADTDALGPYHPSVANDQIGLARLYVAEGKYAQAEPLLLRALAIYEQAYGFDNILAITACTALASAEFHLGHVEKAESLYRNALSQGQTALGPNNFETANILNQLAYLYFHQGKLEDARTFYQWALSSTEGALGNKDPLVAACLKDYALVLRSLGRNTDADVMEDRASKIPAKTN